ncbi:hypothetical protein EC845_1183 [Comamonas sp. BIGb0124]|nr:hypothetical protein EC845_1183 [Comamonas sp. BIGb0124]
MSHPQPVTAPESAVNAEYRTDPPEDPNKPNVIKTLACISCTAGLLILYVHVLRGLELLP